MQSYAFSVADKSDYMDFSQFLSVMHRQMSTENVSEEIFKAFQASPFKFIKSC